MSYTELSPQRRKGVYLRSICGIRKAVYSGKRVTFLTLTTSVSTADGLTDDEKMELIGKSWHNLVTYLHQLYGDFETFSIITNEGHGVIHVLISGLGFVYWMRIVRLWNTIHGSQIVSIMRMKGDAERISSYLMSQYLKNQESTKAYFRMSKNWICRQFMSYWRIIKNCSRDYSKGHYIFEFGRWHYPVDYNRLIKNFKLWIRYYIRNGERLGYVPDRLYPHFVDTTIQKELIL